MSYYPNKAEKDEILRWMSECMEKVVNKTMNQTHDFNEVFLLRTPLLVNGYLESVFIIKIPNNLKDEDPIEKLLGAEIYHRPILYNFEMPEKFKVQVEIDTSDVLKKEKYIEMEVNKKQRIICSGIWFKDNKKHFHQPINIKTGFVVAGLRHHNCYATIECLSKKDSIGDMENMENIEGFITSENFFVNRIEAAEIAYKSGQIKEKVSKLFSENIY